MLVLVAWQKPSTYQFTYMLKRMGFRSRTSIGGFGRKRLKRKTSRLRSVSSNASLSTKMGKYRKSGKRTNGIPNWLKCVPEGRHGSGTLQKRLWRLTSDYCRIRDFLKYGTCVATHKVLRDWNDGQAGHYRSYTACNGMYKFSPQNIHLQTAQSNSWPDSKTWETFNVVLRQRYGDTIIDDIDRTNRNTPLKITTELVMADIEKKIQLISELPTKPPYWNRLIALKPTQESN